MREREREVYGNDVNFICSHILRNVDDMWGLRVVIIMGHQEGREFYIKEIKCSAYHYCDYYYWILLASPVSQGRRRRGGGGERETAEHVVGMFSQGVVVK
jgi:hypothetical protein